MELHSYKQGSVPKWEMVGRVSQNPQCFPLEQKYLSAQPIVFIIGIISCLSSIYAINVRYSLLIQLLIPFTL